MRAKKTLQTLKIIILLGLFLAFSDNTSAQASIGGIKSGGTNLFRAPNTTKTDIAMEFPLSRLNESFKPAPSKVFRFPQLKESQAENVESGKPLQIGTIRPFEDSIEKVSQGNTFPLASGKVWVAGIVSESAAQVRLHFKNLNLPAGAKIFVYSNDNSNEFYEIYEKSGDFWTPPIEGDDIVIEYFTPDINDLTKKQLPFEISEISHINRNPIKGCISNDSFLPPQLPCHNDVPLGWDEIARSSALVQFTLPNGEFLCTGTLLNSTSQDFNPILLVGNSCFNTQAAAQSLRVYWFYFNGDTPSSFLPRSDTANLLATGVANDFTLVQIMGAVPTILGVVYSGWDSAVMPIGTTVTGLHYPLGSHIRYSSGTTISGYCPTLPSACSNFIGVEWNSGAIESGSNGSGLWKGTDFESSRLVGILTNGVAACTNGRGAYSSFNLIYPNISQYLQGGTDDLFDNGNGNDSRANAVTVQTGNYPNLIVKWFDEDWYKITVPANHKISVTANFINKYGDIDLDLYRGSETQPISVSYSTNNTEIVEHTAVSATTYYIAAYFFDGARNNYNLNISLQQVSANLTKFDYDGDGKSDISIYRPSKGEWWYLRSGDGQNRAFQFGNSTDKIVPADYTGDGKTDVAFFRPSTSEWFILRSEDGSFYSAPFGASGDIPIPADYDGDGKADLAVFRPSNKTWYILRSSGGTTILEFGATGDVPVVADYDGDGKADIAIYRPSKGEWWLLRSSDGGNRAFQFGNSTDKPVPADYTGDGKTDVAFFRPSTREWFILRSENSSFYSFPFGTSGDIPIPGDYDGDGKADPAVWRESDKNWYLLRSQSGFTAITFGATGDKPVPSAYIP